MESQLIKDFDLPKYIKGKSFAEASKAINNKFKDREGAEVERTKEELLGRLAEAQEFVKMQESLKANSTEIEPSPNQMSNGGLLDMGMRAFGNTGIDTSGQNGLMEEEDTGMGALNGAMQGAQAGSAAGPYGMLAGAIVGGIGGVAGTDQANKDIAQNNKNANILASNKNRNDFNWGGWMLQSGVDNAVKQGKSSKFMEGMGKVADWTKENYGDVLRTAPAVSNALQLKNLERPEQVTLDRMDARYKKTPVDERALENIVQGEANNNANALTNAANGSAGALRTNLLANSLNSTKALGDAFIKGSDINRRENQVAQQFNNRNDMMNLRQGTIERQMNDQNEGAYNTAKSALQSQLATDIGNFGKEKVNMKQVAAAFGYRWDGKYMIDKSGKKIDPQTILNTGKNESE